MQRALLDLQKVNLADLRKECFLIGKEIES